MITPILENLIVQGLAQVYTQTVGQNGVCTISVPDGKSIVITDVNVQPLFGANLRGGATNNYGFDATKNFEWDTLNNFQKLGIGAKLDLPSAFFEGISGGSNIVNELLNRGVFQVELYSIDNQSVFTYANEYIPVPFNSPVAPESLVFYLPTVTEHKTNSYSVHKNNVHIRLRFFNDNIKQNGFTGIGGSYFDNNQTLKDINNTIPETRNILDINSANLFFQTALFSYTTFGGKYGYYPFGVETNYTGSSNLSQYESNNFVLFPYDDAIASGNDKFTGLNGDLAYFQNTPLGIFLKAYCQLFVPYINIQYVLINEKPDGNILVTADKYNNVTIKK